MAAKLTAAELAGVPFVADLVEQLPADDVAAVAAVDAAIEACRQAMARLGEVRSGIITRVVRDAGSVRAAAERLGLSHTSVQNATARDRKAARP